MTDISRVPGAFQEQKTRELPNGGIVTFEMAPAGWLARNGEPRYRDYRAYYFTPQPVCGACDGSGRMPSVKRPGNTVLCSSCRGSGEEKRQRMVSVTTLLDPILAKGGLPPWYEARGIEGAVEAMLRGLITESTDPADAVKIVRSEKLGADKARDLAADRGINIHSLLEDYMLTGNAPSLADHPVEHHGYLQGLSSWLLARRPEPEAIEELVCNPAARYAGRRDLVARVAGCRVGYDAKTQEKGQIFSSAHLQLQLYEDAAIAGGDEPCDMLRVVVFAENGEWREMPCEATPKTTAAALAYYAQIHPIELLCDGLNMTEKKARWKAAA